ncbi:hypothetical protein Droror1_Dr00012625 [Drosera rotundifolia]
MIDPTYVRRRVGKCWSDFHEIGLKEKIEDDYTEELVPIPTYWRVPRDHTTISIHEPRASAPPGNSSRLFAPPAPPRRSSASPSSVLQPSVSPREPCPHTISSHSTVECGERYACGSRLELTLDPESFWFHDHSVITYVTESFES